MARRREQSNRRRDDDRERDRNRDDRDRSRYSRRKSEEEARIERATWFLMVLVFGVLYLLPENTLPRPFAPFAGGVILLGAGLFQYARRWRVSPTTWIGGTVLLVMAVGNLTMFRDADFFGPTLLIFAGIIGIGILTGET